MSTRDSKEILNLIKTLKEANAYLASSEEMSLELLEQVITNCLTASDNISQTLQTFCYQWWLPARQYWLL